MREVTVEALREEILRVRDLVTLTRVFHFTGAKLHGPGARISMKEIQAMQQAAIHSVHFLEPGESEQEAQRLLTTAKVDPAGLAIGDVFVDPVLGPAGEVLFPAGAFVDAAALSGKLRDAVAPLTIRKRGLRGGAGQASSYLSLIPAAPARPPRPDSRLTRAMEPSVRPTRALLAPHARVLVTVNDDFQRSLILNMIAGEGHDVLDRRWVDVSLSDFQSMNLDVIVLDLADALPAIQLLRKSDPYKTVAVLVAGPEDRRSETFKAITAGANGSVAIPPKRDALLDKLHATVQAFGRRVKLKPAVLKDRRALPREGGHMTCTLQDKFLKSPLPVTTATLLDVSDAGLRIEYVRPQGPATHAYMGHAVHPQHFFFNYAKDNPLGRDVTVSLPSATGRTLEGNAKFVHISSGGQFEVAGLVLQRMKSSVREHMSTVRGGITALRPPSTTRKAF